ncbi:MAG: hypothetical protein PHN56_06190, partial [Candidatus Nanoarchaeia archaeon]|nr:hypothetical protein [Candidatus Nanoarchaeia archaeon]
MIVDEAKFTNWQPLADLYSNQGLQVQMTAVSDIEESMSEGFYKLLSEKRNLIFLFKNSLYSYLFYGR